MTISLKINHLVLLALCFLVFAAPVVCGQETAGEFQNAKENQNTCLKCHGKPYYEFYNDWTETNVRKIMPSEFHVDSAMFYNSSHWDFKCTDCHSPEYETFPHNGELRLELLNNCIDCHGGDEKYEHFKFEQIELEFGKSVHSPDSLTNFSCWGCHDPHTYKLDYRNTENLIKTIEGNNEACMKCHSHEGSMKLYSDGRFKNLDEIHDFLPNQKAHFNKVRCLDCHAQIQDEVLVAHNVLPAEKSVKNCKECHSKNTMLLASLYKYQSIENRKKFGFYNATILNESYVIGASKNYFLNFFTIVVFALSVLAIAGHSIILRISKKKNHGK